MERGWRSGPRLPNSGPRSLSEADIADPADGAKVPRCKICGLPSQPGNKIIPGQWGYLRYNIALPLCERCIRQNAPDDHRAADPLTLDDVA